jgi:glucose 1-dehydrogenase
LIVSQNRTPPVRPNRSREATMTGQGLAHQTALVTGASGGIGRAIARALAAEGAAIALNYHRNGAEAEALAKEIGAGGGRSFAVQADVAQQPAVDAMFADVAERLGAIDILVAGAGIQRDSPIADMSVADWRQVLDTNLTGQFLCAQAAIKAFRGRTAPPVSRAAGKIICISSVHELIPWAYRVNYAASKGGVMMLMKSLAQEVAAEKIRVNSVAPGAIRTNINRDAWETPAAMDALLELIPYGRIGEPEDVARAAVWLASDESDYVTGTTIYVDGGMTLYPGFDGEG